MNAGPLFHGRAMAGLLLAASVAALLLALLATESSRAEAQATGRVSGVIRNGTAGAESVDGARVQLIVLAEGGDISSSEGTVAPGGRYAFDVEPNSGSTYIARAVYEGIQYIGRPLLLSPEAPEAEQDFTIYEVTEDAPPLEIVDTTVTLLAIDPNAGEIALVREDVVHNPADRVFVAGEGGTTLTLPLPEETVEAAGLSEEGEFRVAGQVLETTAPLRPGENVVVTRYLVGYDPTADRYRLRVTAPLETGSISMRIPERFARNLELEPQTARAGTTEIEGETLRVLQRQQVPPGQSAAVGLSGFVPRNDPNALTERAGAGLGVLAALATVAAATWWRQNRATPSPAGDPERSDG